MRFLLVFLFLFCSSIYATQDYYRFDTPAEQARFQSLTSELRCLVCQNQTLAESNSALANDLRSKIYDRMRQGQSDADIIQYLISRYGDFILYNPPLNARTIGLWLLPFCLLIFAVGYLMYYIRKEHIHSEDKS